MSDEKNWIKAVLALNYTRDGLAPFVADQAKKRHQQLLEDLGVDSGTQKTCSLCTNDNLLPDHSRKHCPLIYSRHKCFCKRPTGRRKCPNNVCSRFFDLIIRDTNRVGGLAWNNTDPTKWCSDYWEYAKCFIDSLRPEYRDVHSAADSDLQGLIRICINNKAIHATLDYPGIFTQCQGVCYTTSYARTHINTDEELDNFIDKLIVLLEDECLAGVSEASQALQRLFELKRRDFIVSDQEIAACKDKALAEIGKIRKQTSQMLKSKTMKLLDRETQAVKLSNENITTTSGNKPKKNTALLMEDIGHRLIQKAKEILGRPQTDTTEIQHIVERLLDQIRDLEAHQTGLGDSASGGEDYDSNIQETTKLFHNLLGQNLRNPDEDLFSDSGLTDSMSTMSSQYPDDEASLEKENVTQRKKDYLEKTGQTQAVDDTQKSQGLGEEGLLDSRQLTKLRSKEGRTSPNVKKECDKICASIKARSDQIVHVWPAYKPNEETTVVFVVFAEKDIKLDLSWDLEVRIVHQYSEESKIAMYCKENSPLSTERSRQIGDIIDKYAVELTQKHSYLSAISASSVISKHFGTINQKILPEPCIVLSVLVKQFIPLNEEPFPTMLDGIPVDVREGGVQFCGASAEDFHDQLRMGCKISSSFLPQKFGTLGGFVEHSEYGLCGFTCAHVILSDKEKLELKGKGNMKGKDLGLREIFQPMCNPRNKIGRVVEVTYKEGTDNNKSGVDLALFKIEQRPPTEGNFPDNQGTTTTVKYESGKVWGKDGIPTHQPMVQKFGFATGLTHGQIQFDNAVVKEIPFHSEMEIDSTKFTTTLYKQYHIKSNDVNVRFSELGDSGALVFMKDDFDQEGDLRCIGMLEGIWNDNTYVVTPITAILEELKVTQLKSFVPIVTWKKIDERLKEMEERIMIAITRGNTN